MAGLVPNYNYRDLRQKLVDMTQGSWHVYYRGNLGVGRRVNQNVDLVARLARGLEVMGLVHTAQKRDAEGIMEYRLYTKEKLSVEDLDAAMQMTSRKGEGYVAPLEPEQ